MAGARPELAAGRAPTCSAKVLSAGSPELPILRLWPGPAGGPEFVIFIIASRRLGRRRRAVLATSPAGDGRFRDCADRGVGVADAVLKEMLKSQEVA
jgi:hypothetical protein